MKQFFILILFLCSASVWGQVEVQPIGNWQDSLIPPNFLPQRYNDVWGFVHDGVEYAVIGSTIGSHFIDLSDPDSLKEVAFIPGVDPNIKAIHRDYKSFDHYIYSVSDEDAVGVQVMDFSYLPDSVHLLPTSTIAFLAHDCWVDTAKAKLYTCGSGLRIYDLADPAAPNFLAVDVNLPYIHDFYIRNDTAFLNCGGQGLYVVDCSNPSDLVTLGTMETYPQQGYNHSGWWDAAGKFYYLADETHGKDLKVVTTDDLTDMSVLSTFNADSPASTSIPHNLMVDKDIVYVSYYFDGLQVFDVRNPKLPKRIAYYDSFLGPDVAGYDGAWGVYALLPSGRVLLSDMQTGLYLFDPIELPTQVKDVTMVQDLQVEPNPTHGLITIQFNFAQAAKARIEIVDKLGRLLSSKDLGMLSSGKNRVELADLVELPNGEYIVRVLSENNLWQKVIVKQ